MFFHNALRDKQRKNHISFVKIVSGITKVVFDINEKVSRFFEDNFSERIPAIPMIDRI